MNRPGSRDARGFADMPVASDQPGLPRLRALHLGAGNRYGGVESLLVTIAQRQGPSLTMDQHFAVCFEGRWESELRGAGAVVHRLAPVRLSRPFGVIRARRRLGRLLQTLQPDLLISHSNWVTAALLSPFRPGGASLVAWVHGIADGRDWIDRIGRRPRPDRIIANSQYTASLVAPRFPGVPIQVLYGPVAPPQPGPPGRRESLRAELGVEPHDVVLVMLSRIEPCKGHEVLIRALSGLRTAVPWKGWIVGSAQTPAETTLENHIRQMVRDAGLQDRVQFLGQRADVRDLLTAADVYCQPNTGPETFGVAFVEALYSQLPVVTSNFGGAREIVDPTCGRLIPPGDVAALASVLGQLVDNTALRRQLAQGGPLRAAALCDPDRQVVAIDRALQEIALRNPP